MARENPVQRAGWLRVSRWSTVFRLNTGKAWLSSMGPKGVLRLVDNAVKILAPRPIAVGLGLVNGDPVTGPGDLLGRTTIEITQAMVGQRVAVFTSLEAKNSEGGRVSADQKAWGKQTIDAGGIYGVFTSADEAERIVLDWCEKRGAKLP